jgi:uncharacterized Zn finger protein
MFKCQKCSKSTSRPHRIVTERKMVKHNDGTQGSQIVSEMRICDSCAGVTPEAVKPEKIAAEPAPVVEEAQEASPS